MKAYLRFYLRWYAAETRWGVTDGKRPSTIICGMIIPAILLTPICIFLSVLFPGISREAFFFAIVALCFVWTIYIMSVAERDEN